MKHFSYKDFNIENLIDLKQRKRLTIGLALPVYNEGKMLAETIKTVKSCGALLDEIISVDSGSSDNSRKICRDLDIKVITDKEASEELNVPLQRGKGWNLWASVYYLNTDIIVWIDADIQNIDRRFITGIVGPMIIDEENLFIKGYYHRPKEDARVTEILVRPFISMVFPELCEFIQPLSGEYGGRREFLEKIDFYSGYSVEIAVLLQAIANLKPTELGQSYLERRVHELQSVAGLGKMSSNILHTLLRMAHDRGRIRICMEELPKELRAFTSDDGADFIPQRTMIADKKLPPMITVKRYAEKHQINRTS